MNTDNIQLTQYTHGGGCGCKIAPQVLDQIIQHNPSEFQYPNLIVGNHGKEDAAVYQLNDTEALVATTDFFTPIVNDPFIFGKIAAANAISDVYAMGGTPILALAILGWPIKNLPVDAAKLVLDGARSICTEAGIPIAGGHSIDTTEPIFGLSVNGKVKLKFLKQNNQAKEGDLILLTKPIGVGIYATASKRGALSDSDLIILQNQLTQLNKVGEALGRLSAVHAMTDVTGFGLLGHLMEVSENANLSCNLYFDRIPILDRARYYLDLDIKPGATARNWEAFKDKIELSKDLDEDFIRKILPDPQTNGGLLVTVSPNELDEVQAVLKENGYTAYGEPIGEVISKAQKTIFLR